MLAYDGRLFGLEDHLIAGVLKLSALSLLICGRLGLLILDVYGCVAVQIFEAFR